MTEQNEQRPTSRVVLPSVKRPVGRPPKHGAFTGAELVPIANAKTSEIIEVLEGAKIMVGRADMVPIRSLASVLAKIELMDRYFAACGIFDENGQIRPNAMKIYLASINAATRLCDQLGMTPQSRVRLGIGLLQAKKDLAAMMSETEEEPA